jgi:tetratricopeptide (TPR) repeat protein
LGSLYVAIGDYSRARTLFQRALSLYEAPVYRIGLGLLEETHGSRTAAVESYGEAVSAEPATLRSRFFRELSVRDPAMSAEVVAMGETLQRHRLTQKPSPILLARSGDSDLILGRPGDARRKLTIATSELPNLSAAWQNLAEATQQTGNEYGAELALRRATVTGANSAAWFQLGRIAERSRDIDQAILCYLETAAVDQGLISSHANRVPVMYATSLVVKDDIIPEGFLSYYSLPTYRVPALKRLVILYQSKGDVVRSNAMQRRLVELHQQSGALSPDIPDKDL